MTKNYRRYLQRAKIRSSGICFSLSVSSLTLIQFHVCVLLRDIRCRWIGRRVFLLDGRIHHTGCSTVAFHTLANLVRWAHETIEQALGLFFRDDVIGIVVAHAPRQLLVGHWQTILLKTLKESRWSSLICREGQSLTPQSGQFICLNNSEDHLLAVFPVNDWFVVRIFEENEEEFPEDSAIYQRLERRILGFSSQRSICYFSQPVVWEECRRENRFDRCNNVFVGSCHWDHCSHHHEGLCPLCSSHRWAAASFWRLVGNDFWTVKFRCSFDWISTRSMTTIEAKRMENWRWSVALEHCHALRYPRLHRRDTLVLSMDWWSYWWRGKCLVWVDASSAIEDPVTNIHVSVRTTVTQDEEAADFEDFLANQIEKAKFVIRQRKKERNEPDAPPSRPCDDVDEADEADISRCRVEDCWNEFFEFVRWLFDDGLLIVSERLNI